MSYRIIHEKRKRLKVDKVKEMLRWIGIEVFSVAYSVRPRVATLVSPKKYKKPVSSG